MGGSDKLLKFKNLLICDYLSKIWNKINHAKSIDIFGTVICRNKTSPSTGVGIRPFLTGLYYHLGKKLNLCGFQSNF